MWIFQFGIYYIYVIDEMLEKLCLSELLNVVSGCTWICWFLAVSPHISPNPTVLIIIIITKYSHRQHLRTICCSHLCFNGPKSTLVLNLYAYLSINYFGFKLAQIKKKTFNIKKRHTFIFILRKGFKIVKVLL